MKKQPCGSFSGRTLAYSPPDGIIEAIERIHAVLGDMPLDVFETDWQRQWLVERGVELVSEASRRLTDELKARHPEIPWQKVAGIGNVLRHDSLSPRRHVEAGAADLPALEVPRNWRQSARESGIDRFVSQATRRRKIGRVKVDAAYVARRIDAAIRAFRREP